MFTSCFSAKGRYLLKLLMLFIVFSFAVCSRVAAKGDKDSAILMIKKLSSLYQKGAFTEKQYLDTIPRRMSFFQSESIRFTHKELLSILSFYRSAIWDNSRNENRKQDYYTILCHQAYIEGRSGEMFYYAERISELRQHNNASSVISLLYISSYYYAHLAFSKATALYDKNRKFILSLPQMVQERKLEKQEIMRSSHMLSSFGICAYKLKDTIKGQEIEHVIRELIHHAALAYPSDKEMLSRLNYSRILCSYERNLAFGKFDKVGEDLQELNALLNDPNTPDYLKGYVSFILADRKALFFLDTKQNDSSGHYINDLYQTHSDKLDPANAYMVKKYEARLLYNKGLYKPSEDTLVKALEMLEATSLNTSSEIDEIAYALTKVEEQQLLLQDSAKKQKESDRQFAALGFGTLALLGGSLFTFGFIRRRQKMRFWEFQLNLARNIHDEANPALLYARMLAKSQRPVPEKKSELEQQIEHTMELTRSLAHDLKSTQHLTIGDLILDIRATLEKLSVLSGFSTSVAEPSNKKRFLSHYQVTNLKAIVQECISNSIKHAEFKSINIDFSTDVNALKISYSDNGQGWKQDQWGHGIGLKNLEDRINKLNGTLAIDNNYPNGYQIKLQVKLS